MLPESLREASDWLQRAARDLAAGRVLLAGNPVLPEMVAYHARQAGEKSLKAFLAAHGQTFPLTHNLNVIVTLCQAIDPGLTPFVPAAQVLTPLATAFRYPGGPLAPSLDDAEAALSLAQTMYEGIRECLNL